jgi:hypothetical protein
MRSVLRLLALRGAEHLQMLRGIGDAHAGLGGERLDRGAWQSNSSNSSRLGLLVAFPMRARWP